MTEKSTVRSELLQFGILGVPANIVFLARIVFALPYLEAPQCGAGLAEWSLIAGHIVSLSTRQTNFCELVTHPWLTMRGCFSTRTDVLLKIG